MQKACEKNAASQRVTIHEIEDQLNRSEKNNFVEDERFHLIACTSNCKNERDGGKGLDGLTKSASEFWHRWMTIKLFDCIRLTLTKRRKVPLSFAS